jgi:stress response protein SCP2
VYLIKNPKINIKFLKYNLEKRKKIELTKKKKKLIKMLVGHVSDAVEMSSGVVVFGEYAQIKK